MSHLAVSPRRGLLAVGLAAGVVLVPAASADATVTRNDLGCAGSAKITGTDESVTVVDVNQPTAVVPRQGSASWSGSLATATHNHSGEITLRVGAVDVQVGQWGPSRNASDQTAAAGQTDIPSALQQAPAGRYRLRGFHQGDEGRCEADMEVEIQGGPLSNAAGYAGFAGTALAAALLAFAARPRRMR